jgi:hypothetical protein
MFLSKTFLRKYILNFFYFQEYPKVIEIFSLVKFRVHAV